MLNKIVFTGVLLCGVTLPAGAQNQPKPHKLRASDIPTSGLISKPGPSFVAPHISRHPIVIVYGDQRFTDPSNTHSTNPKVRKWLVNRIAEEKPDAILLNGDVPLSGDVVNDYKVYKTETKIWRDEHLNVYPALGNHEFHGDPWQALGIAAGTPSQLANLFTPSHSTATLRFCPAATRPSGLPTSSAACPKR